MPFKEYKTVLSSVLSGKGHLVNLRQRLCCSLYRKNGNGSLPHADVATHCTRDKVIRGHKGGCNECAEPPTGHKSFGTQVLNELVLDRVS